MITCDVSLISFSVELGIPPRVVLVLSTGRNDVSKAMLRISSPGGIQYQLEEAEVEGEGMSHDPPVCAPFISHEVDPPNLELIDTAMVLFDLKAASTVRISIPYTETAGYAMVCHDCFFAAMVLISQIAGRHSGRLCNRRRTGHYEDHPIGENGSDGSPIGNQRGGLLPRNKVAIS